MNGGNWINNKKERTANGQDNSGDDNDNDTFLDLIIIFDVFVQSI